MKAMTQATLVATGAAICLGGSAFGLDNPPDDWRQRMAELERSNAELKETVRQLQASQSDQWLTEQRATEIRGIVQDVLADVDMRSSMLQGGGGAGYDNGFNIFSGDGNFSLTINGVSQTRFIYHDGDGSSSEGVSSDNDQWGFHQARTRLMFSGYVMDPSWQYFIQGAFGEDLVLIEGGDSSPDHDGLFVLYDAFVRKVLGNGMGVTFGQFKLPFLTEEINDAWEQLAVERSIMAYSYGKGRSIGIMADYEGDSWRWRGALSNGMNLANVPYDDSNNEFAITTSFDYLFNGSFDQFDDGFHSRPGSQSGQMLHAALHFQTEDDELSDGDEILELTVDIQVEYDGWSAFAALMYEDVSFGSGGSADRFGFVGQAEYFFNNDTAVFGRWAYDDGTSGGMDASTLTFGVNKWYGDHVRATIDVVIGLDDLSDVFAPFGDDSSSGIVRYDDEGYETLTGLTPGADDQFAIRTQLQLTF